MSIWAEIKHALNSTLGTNDFEPLNELFFKNKALNASENLYYIIQSGWARVEEGETYKIPKSIKMYNSGSITIKSGLNGPDYDRYTYLNIYINNVLYKQLSAYQTSSMEEVSTTVSFNAGDVITFEIFVQRVGASFTRYGEFGNLRICADMVDTSAMKIQEVSK